jgi:hypothetical protein
MAGRLMRGGGARVKNWNREGQRARLGGAPPPEHRTLPKALRRRTFDHAQGPPARAGALRTRYASIQV